MSRLQQGSIVWAELPAPFGRRPVVVLTRDAAIGRLNNLTIAPITKTVRNIESEVKLEPVDGVPTVCAISLDNIFTIQRISLTNVISVVNHEKMLLVFKAIRFAFDMP